MKPSDLEKLARKLPLSEATRRRNSFNGVAPGSEPQPVVQHEPVAKEKGKGSDPVRHLVRVTSFRVRLLDERNLGDKYFIDALIYAGVLRGDSPKEVKVEVKQEQVCEAAQERTEIDVIPITDYNDTS